MEVKKVSTIDATGGIFINEHGVNIDFERDDDYNIKYITSEVINDKEVYLSLDEAAYIMEQIKAKELEYTKKPKVIKLLKEDNTFYPVIYSKVFKVEWVEKKITVHYYNGREKVIFTTPFQSEFNNTSNCIELLLEDEVVEDILEQISSLKKAIV